ncbi:hypothetical protein BU15DRAFT_69206 [Melanogaster broomeanus]|nr:hypothetical protein BU15DRAFT_69206 [Melanogaster broomeanus]
MPLIAIPPHSHAISKPLTSAGKADVLQARTVPLDTRSAVETGDNGGLQQSTALLIVGAVACFLVLLVGFWLVARPRVPPVSGAPNTVNRRREPDMSERWNLWRLWPRAASSASATGGRVNRHGSHVSPTLGGHNITPDVAIPPRGFPASRATPNAVRDNQSPHSQRVFSPRRATRLSVNTPSLANSHTTDETLDNFRAGAYDLDTDVQLEMLKLAQDDVSAVEGSVSLTLERTMEPNGISTPPRVATINSLGTGAQLDHGDYEGGGAGVRVTGVVGEAVRPVMKGSDGVDVDVVEVDKVAMGRQALL